MTSSLADTSLECSCSTCTCSKPSFKVQSGLTNPDDCLTFMFVTLYENSRWCVQIIYELFFESLWQVLLYVKQEWQYSESVNRTISQTHPVLRRQIHQKSRRRKENTSVVVIPVRSTDCQTEEVVKTELETIDVACNQSERSLDLQEPFCRRLQQPLIFMNREMTYQQNRISFSSEQMTEKKETFSYKSLSQPSNQDTKLPANTAFNSPAQIQSLQRRKSKQKRRIITDDHIPLVLSTSLHSHVSLSHEDSFLAEYLHQLFTNRQRLR